MKQVLTACVLSWLLLQQIMASEEPEPNVRVQTQWIEISNTLLNNQNATGKNVYRAIHQLVSEKKAKLVHSTLVLSKQGQKGIASSVREIIYPTDYEQQGVQISRAPLGRPNPPVAFEIRNVGVTLETETQLGSDPNFIDLRISPRWITMPKIHSWLRYRDERGQSDIKRPFFHVLKPSIALTLMNNQYQLLSSFAVMDARGKIDASRKLLLFVKATTIPVPKP